MELIVDIILVIAAFGYAIGTFIAIRNGSIDRWAENLKAKAEKRGINIHKC